MQLLTLQHIWKKLDEDHIMTWHLFNLFKVFLIFIPRLCTFLNINDNFLIFLVYLPWKSIQKTLVFSKNLLQT